MLARSRRRPARRSHSSRTASAAFEWGATPSGLKRKPDLLEIWLFIARDSPQAADRLLDRIEAQCRLLADNPLLGRARPEIAPDARLWAVGRYLILYRAQDEGIEVVRVVHGARAIERIEL